MAFSEYMNFIEFKFSAQKSALAPFIGNGTKVKIPSEMKPPLKGDNNKNHFIMRLSSWCWHSLKNRVFKNSPGHNFLSNRPSWGCRPRFWLRSKGKRHQFVTTWSGPYVFGSPGNFVLDLKKISIGLYKSWSQFNRWEYICYRFGLHFRSEMK